MYIVELGLPWWLHGKESTFQCRRCRLKPWVRKIPVRENGNPLLYSSLGNLMNREAWRATIHGSTKSWTWIWLSMHAYNWISRWPSLLQIITKEALYFISWQEINQTEKSVLIQKLQKIKNYIIAFIFNKI